MPIAIIALGSNLGNKCKNITNALKQLTEYGKILKTSFLYSTVPRYVEDQPQFLNCACELQSSLEPPDLLRAFKTIESTLGRTKTIRYGPRLIDVDLVFYDDLIKYYPMVDELGDLIIPHKLMFERDFVLAPLCDIIPDYIHPNLHKTMKELLCGLKNETRRVIQLGPNRIIPIDNHTAIMGILNITPNSFSDGGEYLSSEKAREQIMKMIQSKVDIIDVGGESSKPNSEMISVEEEIERVLPMIKLIRSIDTDVPISIDTVKSEVAKVCLDADANIINDISGGLYDKNMYKLVSDYACPYIVMHRRGDSHTMNELTTYSDLIPNIAESLNEMIHNSLQSGSFLFNLIADPGLGFSKTPTQNCELIKHAKEISSLINNVPLLYGPSRKRFVGNFTKKEDPLQRIMGTAACTSACVFNDVSFVRVHDVPEMKEVIMMSEAIKYSN